MENDSNMTKASVLTGPDAVGIVTVTGGAGAGADQPLISNPAPLRSSMRRPRRTWSAWNWGGFPATVFNPQSPVSAPVEGGYLVVPASASGSEVSAVGFTAVTVDDTGGSVTVKGGGAATPQITLASDGNLTYSAHAGENFVIAGGGNDRISFAGDTGDVLAVTGNGNDTITGGAGSTDIDAGGGHNLINLRSGPSNVTVEGNDTINGGSGSATIGVLTGTVSVNGGSGAMTVSGGSGSVTVSGGSGGGMFTGGTAGNNVIIGGTGVETIMGGGNGDLLVGDSGGTHVVRRRRVGAVAGRDRRRDDRCRHRT